MLLLSFLLSSLLASYQPQADPEATVTCGQVRFTVLTSRLIRMEWDENGAFEDRASLAVVNRRLDRPVFNVKRSRNGVNISTGALTLEYKGNGRFTDKNLSVRFKMGKRDVTWKPGMDEGGNLLGTTRTLDKYDGFTIYGEDGRRTVDPFEKSVISRDGWAVIDESERHLFDETGWVTLRPEGQRQDWYLFAYGHDYLSAIRDYTRIGGRIPLPPKYAFGYWWSRYWLYNDFELDELTDKLRGLGFPADVCIIDMDWHETWGLTQHNAPLDEADQSKGWTGYTWNRRLFPSPENTMEMLHRKGFKTSLNLHPASGIQVFEDCYSRFVKDYLARTRDYDGPENFRKEDGTSTYVPYRMTQKEWAESYFKTVLHPIEKQGVDFWWLDWQQWRESRYVKGLSNTFWLNHTFFEDASRKEKRPMIYHRWGGLGSHRYQVGFSGDTRVSWDVLSYMPWFISTASNVGYCYWGQDIGGHNEIPGIDYTEAEIFTRWVQEGVFTPIFKTHPTRNRNLERRFWMFPEQFDFLKEAVRLRYSLSPYIYTAARQAYDTGIGICRPLYYYWPETDQAYDYKEEYLFGDDILATAICRPADPQTGLAERKMWFPAGSDWYDMATGTLYPGGSEKTLYYTLAENPWFVRASALIPLASPAIQSLQEYSDELYILAVPGEKAFETRLYEDGGDNADYDRLFATTRLRREMNAGGLVVKIGPREGEWKAPSESRRLRLVVPGFGCPSAVRVNGKKLPYSRFAKDGSWTYDGASLSVNIYAEATSSDEECTIECDGGYDFTAGESGMLKRAKGDAEPVKYAQNAIDKYGWPDDVRMQWMGGASRITEHPDSVASILASMPGYPGILRKEKEAFPWTIEELGDGLRHLSYEGKDAVAGSVQRIHIVELKPGKTNALQFAYSEEGMTAAGYGQKNGLKVVTAATFGLTHSFVKVDGETISEVEMDAGNPNRWMLEAGLAIQKDGTLKFMTFDNWADRALRTYRYSSAPHLFSVAPMLIFEGSRLIWNEKNEEKKAYIHTRYPRSAIAQLWDGTLLLIAVDGEEPGKADGMGLPELQEFLSRNFWVRNALNLDGSAALYIKDRGDVCLKGTGRPFNTFVTIREVQ